MYLEDLGCLVKHMALYTYKATDADGKLVTGTVTAGSKREIEAVLKDRSLKLLAAKESKSGLSIFKRGIPTQEKISLCRYLSLIINSGVPIAEGLDLLALGTTHRGTRTVIEDIASSTRRGESLHNSFSKYSDDFGTVFLTMVKTGETSGTLAESFLHLSKQFEQEKDLKGKVMSALLYPIIIVLLMGGVGLVLFTFVLPRLADVFTKLDLDLPLHTRIIFGLSLFMKNNTVLVLVSLAGVSFGLILFFMIKPGRAILYWLALRLPIVKRLILEYNLVRFTQGLSALLNSGVAVTEAVDLSLKSLSFIKSKEVAAEFQKKLTRGRQLSDIFEESKLFPPLMVQLVRIGERTGNLEKTLTDLGEFYQQEVEKSLKSFVTVLEPVMLIIVGVGVGVMVVSVISPIYSLIGQLQSGL